MARNTGHSRCDGNKLTLAAYAGDQGGGKHVAPLLDRCWPAVVEVAQALVSKGEIGHDVVCSALQIPPSDNAQHLALIRSGATPGSFTVTAAVL